MLCRIAVVAHTSRLAQADKLADMVGANTVLVDDGTLGCNANHRRAWARLAETDQPWSVVLEDDAVPVKGFGEQLAAALAAAPSPVVSLYLGRLRPPGWQPQIKRTLATTDKCWLIAPTLLHAVAVAIRTELVGDMLDGLNGRPIDEAVGHWARTAGHKVAYSNPSLVDHADLPTLLPERDRHERTPGRVAWRVGTREHWDSDGVPIR